MHCPSCGEPIPDDAARCSRCGVPVGPGGYTAGPRPQKVPNYLWFSVIMIIICLPMGAAALVYSIRVEKYVMREDYFTAWEASFRARKINLLGLIIMGVAAGAYLLFMLIIIMVVK